MELKTLLKSPNMIDGFPTLESAISAWKKLTLSVSRLGAYTPRMLVYDDEPSI